MNSAFEVINMNKLCRACLITKESFNYVLFENVSPDIYCYCTSLEVHQDDLPKTLCNLCYEFLTKYSEFKKTCSESQKKLLGCQEGLISQLENTEILTERKVDVTVKVEEFSDHLNDDADFSEEITVTSFKTKTKKLKKKHKRKEKKLVKANKGEKLIKARDYQCDICNRKFGYRDRFEAHKLEHQGKLVPKHCTPCEKTFLTWSGLKRHNENEHTRVRLGSLKCDQCGKIFKNRHTLKYHEKTHGERSVVVCDMCGKNFHNMIYLKAHLETHKENRDRPFTCQHCNKKFFTKSILMSHVLRLHTGRKYICHVCSYPFSDKYNLSKHLLRHEGKKMFKCDICDKSYGAQSTLVVHKRTHSGERPFLCSYCPKAFIAKKRLLDHHRVHTGERPFKCNMCEQAFTQSGSLKRHLKIHDKTVSTVK